MIVTQILSYIDLQKMRELNEEGEGHLRPADQVVKMYAKFSEMVLEQCKNQEDTLLEQIEKERHCEELQDLEQMTMNQYSSNTRNTLNDKAATVQSE